MRNYHGHFTLLEQLSHKNEKVCMEGYQQTQVKSTQQEAYMITNNNSNLYWHIHMITKKQVLSLFFRTPCFTPVIEHAQRITSYFKV